MSYLNDMLSSEPSGPPPPPPSDSENFVGLTDGLVGLTDGLADGLTDGGANSVVGESETVGPRLGVDVVGRGLG